ncbi:DUF4250 domain-containing protein [Clostridium sp. FAM 1755]|uniref:DUF4250 domain-containing protein n=2 Tax=Clostridium TaxID=1485 RepID=A0A6M0T597_CLOBO|nr:MULTISPECIES: DUF4250 domain-containing protein [Clostridium]EJP6471525.1 DUF4250 domain-containing protein [Clostridium botulinum]KOR25328.1 hypothetical protein ND00_18010 [Clostridium sp. L74]MDS1003440.1 DUF4250 domain-containing protein [Clostridium sporogenes]NFA62060.1 DUF4250 domain-containing protein [Clostridium botulinum]NFI72224.1 DUF4250 domain-containing protein [Clostridium sporogenes]
MIIDKEQIKNMNPYILLSLVNTKLRDEFKNLKDFCETYDLKQDEIENKMKSIEYKYDSEINQFTSI